MTKHSEERRIPHLPENLYELVSDVKAYPEFLPWCLAARVRQQDDEQMIADLIIGFRIYRENIRQMSGKCPASFVSFREFS